MRVPDVCFHMILTHGLKIDNQSLIVNLYSREWIMWDRLVSTPTTTLMKRRGKHVIFYLKANRK